MRSRPRVSATLEEKSIAQSTRRVLHIPAVARIAGDRHVWIREIPDGILPPALRRIVRLRPIPLHAASENGKTKTRSRARSSAHRKNPQHRHRIRAARHCHRNAASRRQHSAALDFFERELFEGASHGRITRRRCTCSIERLVEWYQPEGGGSRRSAVGYSRSASCCENKSRLCEMRRSSSTAAK